MCKKLQKRQSPPRFILYNIRLNNRLIASYNPSTTDNNIEPKHGFLDNKFHSKLYSYTQKYIKARRQECCCYNVV